MGERAGRELRGGCVAAEHKCPQVTRASRGSTLGMVCARDVAKARACVCVRENAKRGKGGLGAGCAGAAGA